MYKIKLAELYLRSKEEFKVNQQCSEYNANTLHSHIFNIREEGIYSIEGKEIYVWAYCADEYINKYTAIDIKEDILFIKVSRNCWGAEQYWNLTPLDSAHEILEAINYLEGK